MASLRVAVLVLVLANLLALAIWKGWLGGGVSHGEPERLSNQLNPEKIHLVPDLPPPAERAAAARVPAAPAPVPAPVPAPAAPEVAPPACVAFGGLSSEQAAQLSARITKAGAGFKLAESRVGAPSSWWVHVASQGSKEAAERKAAELRGLGVEELFIVQDAGANQYAISLGLFKSEVSAKRHLAMLRDKGVRSAQIATRGSGAVRIEVRGPSDSLASLASDLSEHLSGASRLECAP